MDWYVKDCLKKRGWMSCKQGEGHMIGMNGGGGGLFEGECMGHSLGDEPFTLMRFHSCELVATPIWSPWRLEVHLWPNLQLKGHKGESVFFSSLS